MKKWGWKNKKPCNCRVLRDGTCSCPAADPAMVSLKQFALPRMEVVNAISGIRNHWRGCRKVGIPVAQRQPGVLPQDMFVIPAPAHWASSQDREGPTPSEDQYQNVCW